MLFRVQSSWFWTRRKEQYWTSQRGVFWARTCAQSGTDMKASVPPWDSPGTVSTHRTAALGVSDDFQSDDLNDGPRRRAQSRNVPRLVCVRSANAADADPENYLPPPSHSWKTKGTRHHSPSRVNGSGRRKHHRERDRDGL